MSEINKSYIYSGTIRHRRFAPFDHFFTSAAFAVGRASSKAARVFLRTLRLFHYLVIIAAQKIQFDCKQKIPLGAG